MVNKTLAYEAADSEAAWSHKVMLVADDSASSFEGFTDYAETYLPAGYTSLKVYRSDYSSDAETEAAICSGFDSGALVTLYAGHGSVGIWSDGPIFDTSDIATLSNTGCLSVVITPTCMNGYFVYPGSEGLAEELLRSANGGAVACISPSGMSMPSDQSALVDSLFATILDAGTFYPGNALTHAFNMTFDELGEDSRAIIQTTVYFGDPALKLKQWSGYGNSNQLPVVVETYPSDGARNVTTNTEIRITFSEPMDEVSVAANLGIAPDVAVSTGWEGNTLVIRPVTAFNPMQTYTVLLKGTAQSLAGKCLDGNTNGVANGSPADDVQFSFTPCLVKMSGAVSYDGRQNGDVYVVALPAEGNWSEPLSATNVDLGSYVLTVPAGTNMWIGAFIDSNGDGILGSAEARGVYALNPLNITGDKSAVNIVLDDPDSDGDGLPDWVETSTGIYISGDSTGTDPNNADTDGDGLDDYVELFVYHTDPNLSDTDGDGMLDGWEVNNLLDPTNPEDGADDADSDGLSNLEEYQNGTNPHLPDTDGDGMPDGWEVNNLLDPTNPADATNDADSDGLSNLAEYQHGTNPNSSDTDGDGMPDAAEMIAGTSATNSLDKLEINSVDSVSTSDFSISFQGHTNRVYTLQVSTDLGNPSAWSNAEEATGADQSVVFTNAPAAATGYYRIKVRLAE
jgi:hypothetical protein